MSEPIETTTSSSQTVTSEERLLAALSHISALLSFFGLIVPALVWTFQRRKSSYVAFHALQAMGYQMFTYWVGIAAYLLVVILVMLFTNSFVTLADAGSTDFLTAPFAMQSSIVSFTFIFIGAYVLFGIAGAVLCLMGRDFKYPFLGKRLERYLGRGASPTDPLDEIREDRWVAGMGHASAILMLWGLFVPLVVWLTQKDDSSPRLKFQSVQALVYQLIGTVASFGFMAVFAAVFMGMFAGIIPLITGNEQGALSSSLVITLIIALLIMLVLLLVIALALPTYHLVAMIAGIQVINGKEYLYPLLGKFLARRFEKDKAEK